MIARIAKRLVIFGVTLAVALATVVSPGSSQQSSGYPNRPLTIYCPFAAGSISDIETRAVAEGLKNEFKQPVTVVNVPGASSAVGASQFQQNPADGYSLLMDLTGYLAYLIAAHKIGYSADDFVPVGVLSNEGAGLVGRADDKRFGTLAQIVAYAKSNPNTLSVAGTGAAAVDEVTYYEFVQKTGITATYIPFNGGNQLVAAILGGHVDLGLTAPSNVMTYVASKQMKIFAVAADTDTYPPLPGVPTFKHAGYDFTGNFLRLLFVKKGTSPEIVSRLETAVSNMLASAQWKAFETRYIQQQVNYPPQRLTTLMPDAVAGWTRTLANNPKL